jgi:hypothetical protein
MLRETFGGALIDAPPIPFVHTRGILLAAGRCPALMGNLEHAQKALVLFR